MNSLLCISSKSGQGVVKNFVSVICVGSLVDVGGFIIVAEADVLHHDDGRRDGAARVEVELHVPLARNLRIK